jgi:15-cis-phytoene synthase
MLSNAAFACAQIVEKGDPDRFRAVMAAPLATRGVLFPIFAFNIEVARIPWLSKEPMIVAMRLQWWRDGLAEIAAGGDVRAHDVLTALAEILPPQAVDSLDQVVAARESDCEVTPFEDEVALRRYLAATSGALMWATAAALGAEETEAPKLRAIGAAQGLANYFLALPELVERGRRPLPDGRPETLARMARETVSDLSTSGLSRSARIAALQAFAARSVLLRAASDPNRVAQGQLRAPFRESVALLKAAMCLG